MSTRGRNILFGSIALIFGGVLYIVFRSNSYLAKLFAEIKYVQTIQAIMQQKSNGFLSYYAGDFLWCFSLCNFLQAIYCEGKGTQIKCAAVGFICGIVWEILQYMDIASGTCDSIDIIMYLLASICSVCFIGGKHEKS